MKPSLAPHVPGNTEAERMDAAVRKMFTASRDELLKEVWGYGALPSTRTVDVHVAWLRQKLEENPQSPRHILTIRGEGYSFEP